MTIQNPTYLWAFLGLLIPLAIHLWSRKAGKTVKVGSTQWLIASENTRFSSLQFNEVFLFVIRTLVVLLAVLILLDLVQRQPADARKMAKTWVLTEKALLKDARVRPQVDELVKAGASLHLLEPSMPLVSPKELSRETFPPKEKAALQTSSDPKVSTSLNYWSYLRELDTRVDAPKKVIIFAQNNQQRFQGTRPSLGLEVEWINLPQQRKQVFLLDALQLPKDSLLLSIGMSDESGTQVIQEKIGRQANTKIKDLPSVIVKDAQVHFAQVPNEGIQIRVPTPKHVLIVYDKVYNLDQQYLKAALETVGEYMQTKVEVQTMTWDKLASRNQNQERLDWAIFLGKASKGTKAKPNISNQRIVQQLRPSNQWFIPAEAKPNVYYLQQRVNPEINANVLKVTFLEELTQLLFANPNAQERLSKFDQRQISLGQVSPQKKLETDNQIVNQNEGESETQSYHLLWWLALVISIVVERLIQANRLKV